MQACEYENQRFEKPPYKAFILYTFYCLLIYPYFYLICWASRGFSLDIVRTAISVGSAGMALLVGLSLGDFARKFTEAAGERPTLDFLLGSSRLRKRQLGHR